MCLAGTRANILDDIMEFLTAPAADISTLRIVLLTGVVGCGKTAIAHSVAKSCAQHSSPMLGSSFFFSCEFDERRRPDKLFSTVSRDICDRDSTFRASICNAVDEERALVSAPMSRQFDGLILKPAKDASPGRTYPLAIILDALDALDEGYNENLLGVLEQSVALVPSEFRFIITTRNDATIIQRLRNLSHVSLKEVNIRDTTNCQDVGMFVAHRLGDMARRHGTQDLLDDNLLTRFNRHTEGHFLWAATVLKYVDASVSPTEQLDDLLNNKDLLDTRATEKMNKLYADILSKCPWHDRHFERRYQPCLGALIALRRPLSVSSIGKLLHDSNAGAVFRALCSLLIGALSPDQPVQIAHSSLRDFVTRCNQSGNSAHTRFAISESHHSQRLALCCIVVLNSELPKLRPRVAFIFDDEREAGNTLNLMDGDITEHVWYACEYWINHLQDVKTASDELRKALADFLEEGVLIWMAVCAMKGMYFGVGNFYRWSKVWVSSNLSIDISLT